MGRHYRSCVICGLCQDFTKHVMFFKFPSDFERRKKWLSIIKRNDLRTQGDFQTTYICEKHFKGTMFGETRRKLKRDAVPFLESGKEYEKSPSGVKVIIKQSDTKQFIQQHGGEAREIEVEDGSTSSYDVFPTNHTPPQMINTESVAELNKRTTTVSNENISEPCLEIKQSPPGSPLVEQMPARLHHDDTNEGYQSESYRTSLSNDQDEYDIFGTFVASELRGLNKDFSLVRTVKKKIQLALLDAYDNVGKTEIGKDFPPQVNNNIMNREPSRLIIMTPDKINTSCPQIQPNCVYLNYS